MGFKAIPCDSKRQSYAGLFYCRTLSGYFTHHLPCTKKIQHFTLTVYIQGVTGGMCETSGECSLC